MFTIVVLASTNGTDLQAIIDEIYTGTLPVQLSAVIANRECYAIERAKHQGFHTVVIHSKGKVKEEYDKNLLSEIQRYKPDLIVLVGYMRILSPSVIHVFKNKIINVHPSLIPKYSGEKYYGSNVHKAVLDAGEKESGMTIHLVDEGVDTGKILCQRKVLIEKGETVDSLKKKIQALEKKWYPEIIRSFIKKKKRA